MVQAPSRQMNVSTCVETFVKPGQFVVGFVCTKRGLLRVASTSLDQNFIVSPEGIDSVRLRL